MDQDYPERHIESSAEPFRYGRLEDNKYGRSEDNKYGHSETEMLVERLDKLTVVLERQQENNERLLSMIERQMTVIERLLLR